MRQSHVTRDLKNEEHLAIRRTEKNSVTERPPGAHDCKWSVNYSVWGKRNACDHILEI